MIIEIKGRQYTNPDWRVNNGIGEIRIQSDESFAEIATKFGLEAGNEITQYNDNNEIIGKWYVEGMCAIQMPGEDGSNMVTVKYHISQIGKEAQEALNNDVGDASDAVLELCEMIATMEGTVDDTCTRIENSQSEQGSRLDNFSATLNQHTQSISRWESMYNALADRVARLENA